MRPSRPTTSGAAHEAFSTASSVASTTASNTSFRSPSGTVAVGCLSARATTGRRERDEDLSAAVMRDRAAARQSEPRAARDALELVRGQRSVHGDDGDAATGLRAPLVGRLAEELTDRHAVHDERRRGIEVREDEHADGATDRRRDPARRPDAGLVALRHHPGPGADRSLGDGSASRRQRPRERHPRPRPARSVPPRASCRRIRRRRG